MINLIPYNLTDIYRIDPPEILITGYPPEALVYRPHKVDGAYYAFRQPYFTLGDIFGAMFLHSLNVVHATYSVQP